MNTLSISSEKFLEINILVLTLSFYKGYIYSFFFLQEKVILYYRKMPVEKPSLP